MTTGRRAALLLILPVAGLCAQEPPVDLAPIRAKTEITEEDRTQIRTFVNQRIAKVVGNDAAEVRQAAEDLRTGFDGTEAFKRAYAAVCLEGIGSAFKKAELGPAARLLAVVNGFNVLDAHSLFLEALQDERVGVRAAGAIGLRTLREKLAAAGREVWQRVLDGLKEAGKKERSRDTLKTIYGALDYTRVPSTPDAKASAAAVLELLEARARQYAAGNVSALGADDVGLRLAQSLTRVMEEADRKRLMVVVGTMMKYALERYTSGEKKLSAVTDKHADRELVETRDAMERVILVGEELLVGLLKPEKPPTVSDNLRKLNAADMKVEWQKWVRLLRSAVNQDFSLAELPESQPAPEGAEGERESE
jgi:hypothetical protein